MIQVSQMEGGKIEKSICCDQQSLHPSLVPSSAATSYLSLPRRAKIKSLHMPTDSWPPLSSRRSLSTEEVLPDLSASKRTDLLKSTVLNTFDKILYLDRSERDWEHPAVQSQQVVRETVGTTSSSATDTHFVKQEQSECRTAVFVNTDSVKNSAPKSSPSSPTSLLQQLKAWTCDRKLIRGKLKQLKSKCKYSISPTKQSSKQQAVASTASPATPCGTSAETSKPLPATITAHSASISGATLNRNSSQGEGSIESRKDKLLRHLKRTSSTLSATSSSAAPLTTNNSSWKRLSLLSFPPLFAPEAESKIAEDCSEESASNQGSSVTRDSGVSPDQCSQSDETEQTPVWIMSPCEKVVERGSQTEGTFPESGTSDRLTIEISLTKDERGVHFVPHPQLSFLLGLTIVFIHRS